MTRLEIELELELNKTRKILMDCQIQLAITQDELFQFKNKDIQRRDQFLINQLNILEQKERDSTLDE